jgi:hypothetical protein
MTTIKLKYECTTTDGKCHQKHKTCINPYNTTNIPCPHLKATRIQENKIETWAQQHTIPKPKQIDLKQWR